MIKINESKRKAKVIRQGKVKEIDVETKKRTKRMTPKQKQALRKNRLKAHKSTAKKKRERSMKFRNRISKSQKNIASKHMSKRRSLRRKESFDIPNSEYFLIAEENCNLKDIDEVIYSIDPEYLLNVYEHDFQFTVDVYDQEDNIVFEGIELDLEHLSNVVEENVFIVYENDECD